MPLANAKACQVTDNDFRQLIEIAPEGVTIHQDRRIVFANQAAADQLGAKDPTEIIGCDGFNFIIPADRERIEARVRQLYRDGGQSSLTRFQKVRLDGRVTDVEAVAVKITWDGKPAVLSMVRDITARLQAEARLEGFLDTATTCLWETDVEHRFTYLWDFNQRDLAQVQVLGKTRWELHGIVPDSDPTWRAHVADLEAHRPFRNFELLSAASPWLGQYRSVSGVPIFDAHGVFKGYRGTSRDVSERLRTDQELRESEERFKLALEGAMGGVFDIDLASGEVTYDEQLAKMLGYDHPNDIPRQSEGWIERLHPDDRNVALTKLRDHLEGRTATLWSEQRQRTKSGDWVWFSCIGKVVERDADGRARRLVGIRFDITERKQAEQTIAHMALHDALTGLPNRVYFANELNRVSKAALRDGTKIAVLFLDLDHFKNVNDTLGHSMGDKLLIEVAKRLQSCLRGGDLVARFGGDEFVMVVNQPYDPTAISYLADRMTKAIAMPFDIDGVKVNTSISIGVAIYPDDGLDADRILASADLALYAAKSEGRQTWRAFDQRLQERLHAQRTLDQELRHALDRDQFELHYQPLVSIVDDGVLGFEALIRWNHPERGQILPETFIPATEQNRLIIPLTEWVLREATTQLHRWTSTHLGAFKIAINVSPVLLKLGGFVDLFDRCIAETGADPENLVVEITEGTLTDEAKVIPALSALRDRGATIAIDDFGTGYSSMVRLKALPVDVLKIDRSFLAHVSHDASDAAILESLVKVGHGLGKQVVAEGVETLEQLRFLQNVGCDVAQGFLINRPMAAAQIPAWFERWESSRRHRP